ncbi:T9SS type A sorting domain-containing protein [Tamlana flava]|uniref:DUF4961 domain-containing protein n=1 Tax=Tamlana flava TaxID=3158572 RepID=UPI00351B9DA5
MKKILHVLKNNLTKWIVLLFASFLFTMCSLTINWVNEPSTFEAGSTVNVTIDATLVAEANSGSFHIALLAPKVWDLENNNNLTGVFEYSSSMGGSSKGILELIPEDDYGPRFCNDEPSWEEFCNQTFGCASNNPEDVKWVFLRNNVSGISVSDGEVLNGNITLTLNVGSAPVTTELGYGIIIEPNFRVPYTAHQFTGVKEISLSRLNAEEKASIEVNFYPNPVIDVLTVNSVVSLDKIEFYSIAGQKVKEVNSNFETISINDLARGVYIVKALSERGTVVKKLVVK